MPRKNSAAPESITGRDGYIVRKALLYAVASIQNLPPEKQELSDMADMCRILRADIYPFAPHMVLSVEWHTGSRPDLWPEPEEYLTPEDRAQRDEFNAATAAFKEAQARAWDAFLADNPDYGKPGSDMKEAA